MIYFKLIFTLILTFLFTNIFAQISESEIRSDGIVFPRYSETHKQSISAIQGQCIFNTSKNSIECYNGTQWLGTQNQISFLGHSGPSYILSGIDFRTINSLRIRDSSNSFNGTTFTAPEEGFYYLEGNVEFSKVTEDIDDAIVTMSFGNSGGRGYRIKLDDRRPEQMIVYSKTLYLNVGETARLDVFVDTGGPEIGLQNSAFSNNSHKIRFLGYKVAGKSTNLMNP